MTVILLCGVTVSCSSDDPDVPVEPVQPSETVLMFFPYSGLEGDIAYNITCMKNAIINRGGLQNTRVFVMQAKSQTSARFYEIKYANGKCSDAVINDTYALSFRSNDQTAATATLTDILSRVKSYAPAEGYSLIVGCHGAAWVPAGTCSLQDMDGRTSGAKHQAFGTAGTNYQIDNGSLVAAANATGIHFNYISFDACYMGNVETAYEYRNICDFFISSPNEIMNYGMPYDHVGDALLTHNYQLVVKNYVNFYKSYLSPYGTLSVVDCRKGNLEKLAEAMKEVNRHISAEAKLSDVQRLDGLTPTVFYDLKNYVDVFCTDADAVKAFTAALDKVVPYKGHTEEFYTFFGRDNHILIKNFSGLNTSTPSTNAVVRQYIEQTDWWKATH